MTSGDKMRTIFVNSSLMDEERGIILGKIAEWFEGAATLGDEEFDDLIIELVSER